MDIWAQLNLAASTGASAWDTLLLHKATANAQGERNTECCDFHVYFGVHLIVVVIQTLKNYLSVL
jgi:hypothetical protein